jgi:hypothetical protein
MVALDAIFASHAAQTLAHSVPAMAFVLPIPFFSAPNRCGVGGLSPVPLGAAVGVTAYAMSVDSVRGWMERSPVLVFNSLFLFSLAKAYMDIDETVSID